MMMLVVVMMMMIVSGAGENFLFLALNYFLVKRGKNSNRKVGMMIGSGAGGNFLVSSVFLTLETFC